MENRYHHKIYKLPRVQDDDHTHSYQSDSVDKRTHKSWGSQEGSDYEIVIEDLKPKNDAKIAAYNLNKLEIDKFGSATTVDDLKKVIKHIIKHLGLDELKER